MSEWTQGSGDERQKYKKERGEWGDLKTFRLCFNARREKVILHNGQGQKLVRIWQNSVEKDKE